MSSGTGSPSAQPAMTEFTPKAGERGAHDFMRSLLEGLVAMVKHPFGIHDPVTMLNEDGTTTEACWWCLKE